MSPIVALYILKPKSKIKFETKEGKDEVEGIVTVDQDEFRSSARNKLIAKNRAFKKAVKTYDLKKKIVFY